MKFLNKKGDMPWWMIALIISLSILIFALIINNTASKHIIASITSVFRKW